MGKHNIKGSHTTYSITESGDTWIFTKNSTVISNNNAVYALDIANTKIIVEGLISGASGYYGLHTSGTNVDITVAEGGRIISGGYGIYAEATGSKITVEGHVEGGNGFTALVNTAANVTIDVAKGGKILGAGAGVTSSGDNLYLENHGKITSVDGSSALAFSGYGTEVHNSGKINSDPEGFAVILTSDDGRIVNEKSGTIIGAVRHQADNGESTQTVNHGNIRAEDGSRLVFLGSASDDTLKNDGTMIGYVDLSFGDDVVDLRGGRLDGDILGSIGDDVLITDNAKYKLVETDGQGEDIIKSSVSYKLDSAYYVENLYLIGTKNINATGTERGEDLQGNSGDNVLNGKGGIDYFDGKAGDDLLKSGTDNVENRFFFRTGYDKDTIQHFDTGIDTIYIGHWKAIDDFGEVKSHAKNSGDDVVITAGKDSLTILDMHKADLQADDFSFLL